MEAKTSPSRDDDYKAYSPSEDKDNKPVSFHPEFDDEDPLERSGQSWSSAASDSSLEVSANAADRRHGRDFNREEEIKGSDVGVIEHAISYCESSFFQNALNDFKLKHVGLFHDIAESKSPDEEEQSLQHTEVFSDYNALLDSLLTEDFIRKHGYTAAEFYSQCEDIIAGKFTALFEEHEHLWFVQMLQGWLEYPTFVKQMCDLAIAQKAHQAALSSVGGAMLQMRRKR